MSVDRFDYQGLKRLKSKTRRNVSELLVLKDDNDPFYAGAPRRRELAEWFAELWNQFGFGAGIHVRRIHYRIISQASPILLPSGEPYVNIDGCYRKLIWAARDARYLGLVPNAHFIDQRNGETVVKLSDEDEVTASLYTSGHSHDLAMPDMPSLWLERPRILQPFHVEIIAEKTTVDDILGPIAEQYELNYTSCAGEISLTRCFQIIERAKASQRPVRILYISDFDPGGQGMPVACARKLEFLIRDGDLGIDLQLRPVVLTAEQCEEYTLPRTPLKETERRAAAFEQRYGEGATELDALEALHPGELRRILIDEIERYYDAELKSEIEEIAAATDDAIDETNATVHARFEIEHDALRAELADISGRISSFLGRVKEVLDEAAPNIEGIAWPEPAGGDDDPDPLYDSARDYVEQVDRYKRHQGKKVRPPDPVMAAAVTKKAAA